jgi:hypothetical protein
MKTYRIYKDLDTIFHNFNSLEEAQQWVLDNYDDSWSVILASENEQIKPLTPQNRLTFDIEFGNELINLFLLDNRGYGYISPEDSIALLNKFSDIEKLCKLGAIRDVQLLMQNITVDLIFTQERKDKYVNMINEYLAYYN